MHQLLGLPYMGQKVEVYKANMIIPQIKRGEISENATFYFHHPKECPICGGITEIHESISGTQEMLCMNSQCEGKLINRLDHFCGKKGLDIKGLSKATLEKLIDWEWVKNYEDIFNLENHKMEWITKSGFGEKSVTNILNSIEIGKTCALDKFIAALGIPLIGSRAAKDLAKQFGSWEMFIEAVNIKFNFYALPNFGSEMHSSLLKFDYSEAIELAKVLNIEHYIFKQSQSSLNDMTFVITGKLQNYKNRAELKSKIESLGGKVVDSISSKTTYLINNDINSSSSKNKKAKDLNIPIITEEEFERMV
jgi:DNA ligase (NAD+)